jgi:hypothetical protein
VEPAYIPHGVDAGLFRPPADKAAAKRALGYEGRFVILSDARNQPRKLLPRTLEIYRRFARDKDDVVLHLHCDPNDPAARSPGYRYDLQSDIEFLGLAGKVRTTAGMSIATGLPLSELAAIYQAADVHLLSSWGEGFGLPTLQAAAAGVVPMASDYTASRELVAGHGEAIRIRHFVPDHFGLQRALIDIDDAADKLERLYQDPAMLEAKSQAARRFGEAYDWARIVPQWDDVLRSEVPRLRARRRSRGTVSRVTLSPQGADGPAELTKVVRGAFPGLPEGAQVTIAVAQSQIGQLTAEVLRDASEARGGLTLPVTLPPADPELVRERISGCVYVASAKDLPVLRSLHGIFPGLRVWSSRVLDLEPRPGDGRPVETSSVPLGSDDYRRHLAASTLALDLGGVDAGLPRQAAELRVP